MKARLTRKKLVDNESVLSNLFPVEELKRITTLIYGRPMTAKSITTAYEAALLARRQGGKVLFIVTETNYNMARIRKSIETILAQTAPEYEMWIETRTSGESLNNKLYRLRREIEEAKQEAEEMGEPWVPPYKVIVLDSLGSLAAIEEDHLSYSMRRSVRGRASSIIPVIVRVVRNLSALADVIDGWAFAITHATSMAGVGLYQGISPYKPSFAEKAIHHVGAVVWFVDPRDFPQNVKNKVLRSGHRLRDVKMAVSVMIRGSEYGNGVVFKITQKRGDEGNYPVPEPLFMVEYEVDEEAMI